MSDPIILPMTQTAELKAAGIGYPDSLNAWRWLYRHRHERGMTGAFLRQGRRVLVDVPRFLELQRKQGAV